MKNYLPPGNMMLALSEHSIKFAVQEKITTLFGDLFWYVEGIQLGDMLDNHI